MTQKEIQVYAHWQGFDNPVMKGVLHTTPTRGKEIFSFEYAREWLNSGKAQKFSGHHHTYLSKRFDRTNSGERVHFASAMTLLGCKSPGISALQIKKQLRLLIM